MWWRIWDQGHQFGKILARIFIDQAVEACLIMPAYKKLRPEHQEFKANLGYRGRCPTLSLSWMWRLDVYPGLCSKVKL